MYLLIPETLNKAINDKLDSELLKQPEAIVDRDLYYNQILHYYNEHGAIPDFTIEPLSQIPENELLENQVDSLKL